MLAFTVTVFLMIVTPGPGVLTTAGIGAGFGWQAGIRFLAGLFVGTNLAALIVVSGLFALIVAEPMIRTVLVWASIAYFCWLALKIALAGAKVGFMAARRAPRFIDGVLLQLINPKAYAVNTVLFGGYAFMDGGPAEVAIKFLIINILWVPVHLGWLGAGVTLQRLELSPRVQRGVNFAMAGSLVIVVVLAGQGMS